MERFWNFSTNTVKGKHGLKFNSKMKLKFWLKLGKYAVEITPKWERGKVRLKVAVGKVDCMEERYPKEEDGFKDCLFYPERIYFATYDPISGELTADIDDERIRRLVLQTAWLFDDANKGVKLNAKDKA